MGELQSRNPKYAEIVLIRHGETDWNVERRIQGQLEVDLNGRGRQQAFAVAERLAKEPKLNAVYSSDLRRAFDTAQMIAQSCGVLKVITDPELRERHLGELQGLLFVEADQLQDPKYTAPRQNHDAGVPGGGESYNEAYNRCTKAVQRIADQHIGERVAVVSHGAAIEAISKKAIPSEDFKGKVRNASINILHISYHHWAIKSWGDVTHLKNLGV